MKKTSNNDFLYCLHPKCTIDELKILLNTYNIDFFNEEVLVKTFYYDEIPFFIFDSTLNRQEFYEKLEAAAPLKEQLAEVIYLSKDEVSKTKN